LFEYRELTDKTVFSANL